MTFGATCRFARPLIPGKAERLAVAFEAIPAPLIPALPFGLGARSDQTPSGNAFAAGRQSIEPTQPAALFTLYALPVPLYTSIATLRERV